MLRNVLTKYSRVLLPASGWQGSTFTDLQCLVNNNNNIVQRRWLRQRPLAGYHYPREAIPWEEPRRDFYEYYRSEIEPDAPTDIRDGIPIYEGVGVKVSGYDQCVVDHYAQYVHRLAQQLDITVVNCFAIPTRIVQIITYQATSKKPAEVHHLKKSLRVVHLSGVKSTELSVFVQAISRHVPEGAELSVDFTPEDDNKSRYRTMDEMLILVPD